ncbi:hypothetical protein [Xanthomonas arboricola]|uniref:hypothetical protein n=1 Tax=Xanthomonas arboricola TaxID=56448 RepID=UPI001E65BC8F|nr:hypothetical protein [Xanthomonas arboricola]
MADHSRRLRVTRLGCRRRAGETPAVPGDAAVGASGVAKAADADMSDRLQRLAPRVCRSANARLLVRIGMQPDKQSDKQDDTQDDK